jgi:hypothetical protein
MKRQLYKLVLLLTSVPAILPAQHVLQSELNLPRAGDEIIKQQVQYKNPGRSGENVLWDFSSLESVNPEYKLVYSTPRVRKDSLYILGKDTFKLTDMQNEKLLIGREHNTRYYYHIKDSLLYLLGYENPMNLMHHIEPLPLMRYPLAYGWETKKDYHSECLYSSQVLISTHGSFQLAADAYGMMILPSGDTLKNVLRVHTLQTLLSDSIPSMDNIHIDTQIENHKWYIEGYRYPVFETVKTIHRQDSIEDVFSTAFFYPPQEHFYLEEDEENLALLENENNGSIDPWAGLNYNIYPNPAISFLEIELYLPREANIRAQLRNTMGLIFTDTDKGYHRQGTCNFQIDVSMLPVDNYILNIWLNDYLISEIIMKR